MLSINVSNDVATLLRSAHVLIFTSQPEDKSKDTIGLIEYEFQNILSPSGVVTLVAFTTNNAFNRSIVTCMNATAYEPVIYITTNMAASKNNRIEADTSNPNCIVIEAIASQDLLRMRDRLLYAYYSIIP